MGELLTPRRNPTTGGGCLFLMVNSFFTSTFAQRSYNMDRLILSPTRYISSANSDQTFSFFGFVLGLKPERRFYMIVCTCRDYCCQISLWTASDYLQSASPCKKHNSERISLPFFQPVNLKINNICKY